MSIIVSNSLKLVFVQSTNYIFPLLALPFLLINLGDQGFTQLMVAQAIIQYFVLLVTYGFNFTSTKEISIHRDCKDKLSNIFYITLLSKLILFVLSLIFVFFLIISFDYFSNIWLLLFLCAIRLLGEAILPLWFFQGTEKMNFLVFSTTVAKLICFVSLFLLVRDSSDVNAAALLLALPTLIAGFASLFYIKKNNFIGNFHVSVSDINLALRNSFPIFITSAISSIYTNSTVLIASIFFSAPVSAAFVAADKLRLAVQNLLDPISSAIYPRCSKEISLGTPIFIILKRYALPFVSIGFLLSLCVFFTGYELALIYFSGNEVAASIFKSMFLFPLIISISLVLGYWIIVPSGQSASLIKIYLIGSTVFGLSFFPFVIIFSIYGLVYSVLVTELIIVFCMSFNVWRHARTGNYK